MSSVWKYFTKSPDGGFCNIEFCKSKFVKRHEKDTSTKNFWSHLQFNHADIYANERIEKPPKRKKGECSNIKSTQQTIENFAVPKKTRNENIELDLVRMIARRAVPFSIINDPFFRRMFETAFPDVKMRESHYYLRRILPMLSNEIISLLRAKVGTHKFAITTDGWSALRKPCPSFYSLTLHYRDSDLALQSAVFGVTEITESTNAENIRKALTGYIEFLGLDISNMVCVVRDDAANVKNAAKLLCSPRYNLFAWWK
ncbi:hypothetical protein Ddc_17548 [Ditylenchus destructor]|nr:hypothetical protein Ddc_17548 [Ditylenchus destructor]